MGADSVGLPDDLLAQDGAMVGSDNLNRRSWSHDSELSIAVLDSEPDRREPATPQVSGTERTFARDLRLRLWREHLDRDEDDVDDLLQPQQALTAFRRQAGLLAAWHFGGRAGPRPPDGYCRTGVAGSRERNSYREPGCAG